MSALDVDEAVPASGRFGQLLVAVARRHRLAFIQLFLCSLLAVAFLVGLQKVQQILIDEAFPGFGHPGNSRVLAYVMGGLVLGLLVASLAGLRQTYLTAYLSGRVARNLRLGAFRNLQYVDYGRIERLPQGDISSRLTADLAVVEWALATLLGEGLQLILTFIAAVGTVFWLDWRLGLASIVVVPLFVPVGFIMGPPTGRASLARQSDLGAVATDLQENLSGQFVVRAFSLERFSIGRFARAADRLLKSSVRLTFLSSIYGLSTTILGSIVQLLALGVGGWLVIEGTLTLGTLVAFFGLLGLIITPVQNIAGLVQVTQQASGALARVDELMGLPPGRQPEGLPLAPLRHGIEFDHVSFGYGPQTPVLEDVSFWIEAGKHVAIVGPSGSGKSTLMRILMGFEESHSGAVRVDGMDNREVSVSSLLQQLAVVPQDDFLFNLSVYDNIRLGSLDADEADLLEAVSAAGLDSVVAQLPNGLDTYVGERGAQLSGGQRQRVALARALIRRPSVLILDEATSALDAQTEAAIHEALARLERSITLVMVTHRLTSARDADWIVVLEGGRIVEQGTHEALLERGGVYMHLWQAQAGERDHPETDVTEFKELAEPAIADQSSPEP